MLLYNKSITSYFDFIERFEKVYGAIIIEKLIKIVVREKVKAIELIDHDNME